MKMQHSHHRQIHMEPLMETINQEDLFAFRSHFLDLHPTDQMLVFETLEEKERSFLYGALSPEEFASVFQRLEAVEQEFIEDEIEEEYFIKVLQGMYSDDVADFLSGLPEERQSLYLKKMETSEAHDVKELLSYPDESAGSIMTKEYISIQSTQKVQEVINFLRDKGPDAETIYYLYVIDESGHLAGVLSLRDLIVASPEASIEKVMSPRVIFTPLETDQEEVAKIIQEYDLLALPVVTTSNELVGIVTVDDVMDIIEEEATEDIGEFSASRGATDVNVTSFQAAKKRAPWIILLMFLGLITANVIGRFEETLEAVVLLSVFIPLIMDSAGNTGTQSLAVTVRSLAVGSLERRGIGKMLRRELGAGVIMGLMCAVVLIGLISVFYGNMMLALIVAVSIFLTLSVSAFIGALFPLIINKLKIDPAVASGPFITTLNDIIGLLIYFSIATALLQYL